MSHDVEMYPDVEVSSYAHKDGGERIGCCATHTPTGTEFACGLLPTFEENEAIAVGELRKHYPESFTVYPETRDYWQVREGLTLLGEVLKVESGFLAYSDDCAPEPPFDTPEEAIRHIYQVALETAAYAEEVAA